MDSDYPQPPMDEPEYHGQTHRPQFGQQPKSKKKLFIILGVALGVLLLGGGAAAYLLLSGNKEEPAPKQQTTEQTNEPKLPAGVQSVDDKYMYKSTKLNVGVTYPKTWTLRESTDKQEVILTSPEGPVVKKDGTSGESVFTIKLRHGIIPTGIKSTVGAGVAVADSEVIGYTQPAADQREYTNLSFIGADAEHFNFVLVTGYTEYKAAQAVGGGVDLNGQAYMFAGGFGADAGDTLTFDAVPKAEFRTDIFTQAVEIFESLQLY
jgi:hypothetical protein